MGIPHVQPGEVFYVRPLGTRIAELKTHALVKTKELELLRLILPAGKEIPKHQAPSEITVQCLEGQVRFTAMGRDLTLTAGAMLYLPSGESHCLIAEEDSSLLVTILLRGKE